MNEYFVDLYGAFLYQKDICDNPYSTLKRCRVDAAPNGGFGFESYILLSSSYIPLCEIRTLTEVLECYSNVTNHCPDWQYNIDYEWHAWHIRHFNTFIIGACLNINELRPRDCSDLPVGSDSGVYTIYPTNVIFDVYCDMDTAGFGWTVFQRRIDGATDFFRDWIDYENGFGSLTSEFWLGNNFINVLTSSGNYKLYIHLEDFEGNSRYAEYCKFVVGDSTTNYTLNIGGYSGDAGDGLFFHNGMMFSTNDKDNDISRHNCAESFKGAWWYNKCYQSNLNGQYIRELHSTYPRGTQWNGRPGQSDTLKSTRMMIKRH
ncbi:ficolin-2-like [Mytilus trossulus]|uniref:ficolin-2-like n=1 Tax=Mytilus trossulus TaxID=6551 RepID=UPI003004B520